MAGASTYEQEVLLPGPWGRDHKIYATSAEEEERERERERDGVVGEEEQKEIRECECVR